MLQVCKMLYRVFGTMTLFLGAALLQVEAGRNTTTATHSYSPIKNEKPTGSAFEVLESVSKISQCYKTCDAKPPCAGFALLNASGVILCGFYHSTAGLAPHPTMHDLVAFYRQGSPGPAPAPSPPFPPPPPPPPPPTPDPKAPEQFTAVIETDVGGGSNIVLNVTRSRAPLGVDHFYKLIKVVSNP